MLKTFFDEFCLHLKVNVYISTKIINLLAIAGLKPTNMKKLLFLIAAVVLPFIGLTSCSDDNELPNVDVRVKINGATRIDDTLYVVRGDLLEIEGIYIIDNNKKGAMIADATYYWDLLRVGYTDRPDFGMKINTEELLLDKHNLQITMTILAVDYPVCFGTVVYRVVLVDSADDIPTEENCEVEPEENPEISSSLDTELKK